jgi:methyl-accepting chemotaxis protein
MTRRNHLDPDVLARKAPQYADQTFMGGMRLASRNVWFFFVGLLALGAVGALYFHVDQLAARTLDGVVQAQKAVSLVAKLQREASDIRNHEKDFLLRRDPAIGESVHATVEQMSKALDGLDRWANAEAARQHITTLRDGLAQYGTLFGEMVKLEIVVGLADDKGLRAQLRDATTELETRFRKINLAAALTQLQRTVQFGREALAVRATIEPDRVEKHYETLRLLLGSAQVPAGEKAAIEGLIKAHENHMATILNARLKLNKDAAALADLFAYMTPRLEALAAFVERAVALAQEELEHARAFARQVLAGGTAGAFVVVIGFGLMVMGSVARPLRRLAEVASRLARGERGVDIPARGNVDSVGILARGLDAWMDALAELDHQREELEATKARLATIVNAPPAIAAPPPLPALPPREPEPAPPAEATLPAPVPSARALALALEEEREAASRTGGPIATISQKLARYSQYVSAAAHDVERTEALIRGLAEATLQVADLGTLLASLRDQTNMLVFKSSARDLRPERPPERADENLILFSADVRLPTDAAAASDVGLGPRFDSLRDTIDRAERTLQAAHNAVADVTALAHEIATTASNQALEATNQLLHQSEYLHSLLDDIIAKIQPPSEEKSAREPRGRDTKGAGLKPR